MLFSYRSYPSSNFVVIENPHPTCLVPICWETRDHRQLPGRLLFPFSVIVFRVSASKFLVIIKKQISPFKRTLLSGNVENYNYLTRKLFSKVIRLETSLFANHNNQPQANL